MIFENGPQDVVPTEYTVSRAGDVVGPAVYGHDGAERAIGTGAVPFNDSTTVEPYSSRGPVTHYFGPVNGTTPAPPLGTPKTIQKPDVVATDGGANTFFGSFTRRRLPLLRHLGGRAAQRRRRRPRPRRRSRGDPGAGEGRDQVDRDRSHGVPARRPTAPAWSTPRPRSPPCSLRPGAVLSHRSAAELWQLLKPIANRSSTVRRPPAAGRHGLDPPLPVTPLARRSSIRRPTSATRPRAARRPPASDYVKATNLALAIPAGATTATIPISIKGDTAVEPNETFNLRLTRPTAD